MVMVMVMVVVMVMVMAREGTLRHSVPILH
jgi:hypothetical protein